MQSQENLTRREMLALSAGGATGLIFSSCDKSSPSGKREQGKSDSNLALWYRQPAEDFVEALPLGNGRLGAMVYGGVESERIGLNHNRLWRRKYENILKPVSKYLKEVRKLAAEGKWKEAEQICRDNLNPYYRTLGGELTREGDINPYVTAGDVDFKFMVKGEVTAYRRSLDLSSAIACVEYSEDGTEYQREFFCIENPSLIVAHFLSSKSGALDFSMGLSRDHIAQISKRGKTVEGVGNVTEKGVDADCIVDVEAKDQSVYFRGALIEGVHWAMQSRVITRGGDVTEENGKVSVTDADEAWVLTAISVDTESEDLSARCSEDIASATNSLTTLREKHVTGHQKFFSRADLSLSGDEPQGHDEPTDQWLQRMRSQPDASIYEMLFNYGRYLLISCSRPGNLPANLQGIWNEDYAPTWDSDYHFDMNIEMNYWPAEVCNLSELTEPLFDLVDLMLPGARNSARNIYGCGGVLFPICSDPFAGGNVYSYAYSIWTGGAAWIGQHYWWHWEYTKDIDFLRNRAYPFLKEVGQFYMDFAFRGADGKLVTIPAHSPEQGVIRPDGSRGSMCSTPTSDIAYMREVFTNLIHASEILSMDESERASWQRMMDDMPDYPIDENGRLREFTGDFHGMEPTHRHLSHLHPLFPGNEITVNQSDPVLVEAARKELERRGNDKGGWATVQRACTWARLGQGDMALSCLERFPRNQITPNLFGLYYSWDGRQKSPRPFQIESNFGACMAIAEMLMQSHSGEIRLLPALPKVWSDGYVTGLRARDGFEVDIEWHDGALTEGVILSNLGHTCRVRSSLSVEVSSDNKKIKTVKPESFVIEFETTPGTQYIISPK